jgi:hypothetical protein
VVAGAGNTLLEVQLMVLAALLPHLELPPATTTQNCFATSPQVALAEQTSVVASVTQAALRAQSSYLRVGVLHLSEAAAIGDAVSAQYAAFGVPGMQAPASPCLPAALQLLCVGPVGSAEYAA